MSDPNTTADPSNRFVKQRYEQRLNGICNLMVEYNVTLRELERYFIDHYETAQDRAIRKRTRANQGPIRRERGQNAIRTRWSKYDALRESNVVARDAAIERVKNLQQPDFILEDEMRHHPEPVMGPESQVQDERLTNPMLDVDAISPVSAEPLLPEPESEPKTLASKAGLKTNRPTRKG